VAREWRNEMRKHFSLEIFMDGIYYENRDVRHMIILKWFLGKLFARM